MGLATRVNVDEPRTGRASNELPPRAQVIVREAPRRGGRVPADALRSDDVTGATATPTASRPPCPTAAKGLLPHGVKEPVLGIGPGYGKVQGYRIREEAVDAFTEGLAFLLADEQE
ncbi:hypothetical protein GCM10010347_60760 [Streptomyces cirratus]|uniref:Uncharacterized protein n=1 Tax=Streptomyces cirratus TaxID=68187 RepID=A0ABQ3F1H5_9ACTN|nr:hypothetical protein GCM10010347_60760 [Streptomyces cirratus]